MQNNNGPREQELKKNPKAMRVSELIELLEKVKNKKKFVIFEILENGTISDTSYSIDRVKDVRDFLSLQSIN